MSLTAKRKVTAKNLAANRLNGGKSRGPVTAAGKARSAASNLRHGYYSKSAEVALTALGEDPAEFKRRFESLIDTYEPANALEMSLVFHLARALWRGERFDRVQESMAVKHLERAQEGKKYGHAMVCMPLMEKLERLKDLFAATCLDFDSTFGPEEMKVFEKARGDVTEKTANEILLLLLRLRKPGTAEILSPEAGLVAGVGEVPVAEGEERKVVCRELIRVLAAEIEDLEKRILGPEEVADEAQAQFARDEILARGQEKAALMNRGEESSLR